MFLVCLVTFSDFIWTSGHRLRPRLLLTSLFHNPLVQGA